MANWANVAALGDPQSPDWQAQNLQWIEPVKGQRWQVYKPAAAAFEGLLTDLAKLGYHPISSGGYNYRNIRGSDKLSQHAFGTAIDLNALTNAQGQSATDIPQAAELARKHGLEWGGLWKNNPDPMHFEYTGGGASANANLTPQQQWASGLWQYAQAASEKTGVDPRVIMAQAALETGWGKSAPNNNYFGIKGQGANQKTLEFINGKMTPVQADFRAYETPEQAFSDYANVLMGGRYADVRGAKGLEAQIAALGKSGYATDPDYASKLLQIAQGMPEGGYGSVTPTAQHPPNPTVGAAATTAANSPYALPKTDKKDSGLAAMAKMAMGSQGQPWQQPQIEATPAAARIDQPATPLLDPQQTEARRAQLAQMLARLNQGSLA